MPFRLTRQADLELASLFSWGVTHFGVAIASDYYLGLLKLCELLAQNPGMAREIRGGVRAHPYRSHVIVFRSGEGRIDILRIRHGMSEWKRHL